MFRNLNLFKITSFKTKNSVPFIKNISIMKTNPNFFLLRTESKVLTGRHRLFSTEEKKKTFPNFIKSKNKSTSKKDEIKQQQISKIPKNFIQLDQIVKNQEKGILPKGKSSIAQVALTFEEVIPVLKEERGEKITVIDMSNKCIWTNYFVIVQGKSNKHIKTLAEAVLDKFHGKIRAGISRPPSIEGLNDSNDWMLIDAGNVVIHFFSEEGRNRYDLDTLWGLRHLSNLKDEEELANDESSYLDSEEEEEEDWNNDNTDSQIYPSNISNQKQK